MKKRNSIQSLVRSILEYIVTVCDSHTAHDIYIVYKGQRRAARWVTHKQYQTSCVNAIIGSLVWPTLQRRRKNLTLNYSTHFTIVTSP